MRKFISFSLGVESTTMCVLYGKGAKAIFCDTGFEHKKLYERLFFVESKLKELHDGDFEIIVIKPKVTLKSKVSGEKIEVSSLQDYIRHSQFYPSKQWRYCTRMFKIEPIDKFLREQGDCELMIGLNVDEEDAREGNHEMAANVVYTYPLVKDEYDRGDCIEILDKHGLSPNFPPYMERGGCIGCPFKSKKEYRAMVHLSLDEIEDLSELETVIQDERKKPFRIRQNMPLLRDFINEEKQTLFPMQDQYKSTGSYSCGMFCHR